MYTNGYIFRYAAIMVIIAAALLSSAAMLLKPFQDKNMAIEKMGGILTSADIKGVETEKTITMFNQFVTDAIVIDQDGNVVENYKDESMQSSRAFSVDVKKEWYNKCQRPK